MNRLSRYSHFTKKKKYKEITIVLIKKPKNIIKLETKLEMKFFRVKATTGIS